MKKRLVFTYSPGIKIKAKFSVIRNKIKMILPNDFYCTEMKINWGRSFIFDKDDMVWASLFGSRIAVDAFVKKGKTRILKVDMKPLLTSKCDVLGVRKVDKK